MKRLLLLIAVSIVWSGSVLQAQEYEYVPLVREGVEWGYTGDLGDYRCQIKGDTIIDGTTYKNFIGTRPADCKRIPPATWQ